MKTINTKNHIKAFEQVEKSSANALGQFEKTIVQLKTNNEELAAVHASVDTEIARLTTLKRDIVERIATNDNAVTGLERVLHGE